MVVGTQFLGSVHNVNGQEISTKFFILGIPLVPLSTMFVIDSGFREKRGYEMPVHGVSVLAGYGRMICGAFGVMMLIIGFLFVDDYPSLVWVGASLVALWAVLQFVLGRPGADEEKRRIALGKAVGINALPEWLPREVQESLYHRAGLALLERIPDLAEDEKIEDYFRRIGTVERSLIPFVFTFGLYRHHLVGSPETASFLRWVEGGMGLKKPFQ